MKKKIMILAFSAMLFVVIGWYGTHEYFRPNPDMNVLQPAFHSEASGLIAEFNANEKSATSKYLGKIMSVSGQVIRIEKDEKGYSTVILSDPGNTSSVRCAIDTNHIETIGGLKQGAVAEIKGILTGYNNDITGLLGSDILLNRCVVNPDK